MKLVSLAQNPLSRLALTLTLAAAAPALTQTFPTPMAAEVPKDHLRIGAWNIQHLGVKAQKPADLADYIHASRVDVLALEEIHDDAQKKTEDPAKAPWNNTTLTDTLKLLNQKQPGADWQYLLTDPDADNTRVQMTGVLWNGSRVTLKNRIKLQVPGGIHAHTPPPENDPLTLWTRRPEAFFFAAGKPDAKRTDFALVPLHMKSNSDNEKIAGVGPDMRAKEAAQLAAALPALKKQLGTSEEDIILLGDTNANEDAENAMFAKAWPTYRDLNPGTFNTYRHPGFPPGEALDRIFLPKDQPEFPTATKQKVHGPYAPAGEQQAWFEDHYKRRSDHLLIWCDIQVLADDDKAD